MIARVDGRATQARLARPPLAFRSVNCRGTPGYDSALQRHHLLPRQIGRLPCFARLLNRLGLRRIGFDDFRRNGLLLPAREEAVHRLGMPLHRGPHREYNGMVIEKLGRIEAVWARERTRNADLADAVALTRIDRLQNKLRFKLLDQRAAPCLNRHDPLRKERDYSTLDALAEEMWRSA